jgi:PAS domain S-box-containing protein
LVRGARILIVDDNATMRQRLCTVLRGAGYVTTEAASGAEALRLVHAAPPDLALVEVGLRDLSGFEVSRQLKTDPALERVLVVLMSAVHLAPEKQMQALTGGADGYLTIPFANEELLARVDALVRIKRIEAELSQAEAKFRALVEQLPAITYTARLDAVGSTLYISPQVEPLLGFTQAEWLADAELWFKQLHPDDRPRVQAELQNCLATGQAFASEYRLLTRDGRARWFRDEARVIPDPAGGERRLQGVLFDITARQRAEQALRAAEQRLQFVLSGTPIVLFALDPAPPFKLTFISDSVEAQLGYPPQRFTEESHFWLAHLHEEDAPRVTAELAAAAGSDGSPALPILGERNIRFRFWYADGSHRWLSLAARPVRDAQGRTVELVGYWMDVTDHHTTEGALQESETRFRQLTESIQEVFWLTTPDKGQMLYISPAYEKIWGRSCASLHAEPRSWLEAIHPDDRPRVLAAAHQRQAAQQSDERYRVVRPDGSVRWIRDRAFPIRDAAGQVVRVAGIAEDITALQEAQGMLERRAVQQATLATLSQRARATSDLQGFLDEASARVARTLGVEFCKVLELLPHEQTCLLRAGVGWKEGLVGTARVGLGHVSQCGYTLVADAPVVVVDLHTETRFSAPPLLQEHGIRSGISVVIGGPHGPWGVLAAHDRKPRGFNADDVTFLQAVANLLALAIEHQVKDETTRRFRAALDSSADAIFLIEYATMRFVDVNESACTVLGYSRAELLALGPADLMPHVSRAEPARKFDEVIHGAGTGVIETMHRRKDGTDFPVEVYLRRFGVNGHTLLIAVARDITERKRAETSLRHHEEYFRTLLEHSSDIISAFDAQGTIGSEPAEVLPILSHTPLTAVLGCTSEELRGRNFLELVHPDDQPRLATVWAELVRSPGGVVASIEGRLRHKDGAWRVLESSAKNLLDNPTVRAVVVHSGDITERRQTLDALAHSRAELAALMHSVEGIVWEADAQTWQFTFVSQQAERLLGYPVAQWLNEPTFWMDHLHPEDRALAVEQCRAATAERRSHQFEYRMIAADGRAVWLRDLVTVTPANGHGLRLRGLMVDLTERKQTELALRESELLHHSLVESLPLALFRKDAEGRFTFANQRFCGLLGLPLADIVGKTDADLFPPDLAAKYRLDDRRVLDTRQPPEEIEQHRRKDARGSSWMQVIKTPLFNAHGQVLGVQGLCFDVTERKHLEERLRQSKKMEAIGHLAGGIAHDFNNLLTVVTGYANLLIARPDLDAETSEYLNLILGAAQRAAGLTRQLLTFSRKQTLQPESLRLNEVLTELAKMLRRVIGEDIALTLQPEAALPLLHADRGMLEQVVMNLVVNARDAMPKGGQVVIRTAAVTLDAATAQRDHPPGRAGDFVCLSVSDTGCGMTPEVLEKIFEPFFTTKGVGKGTGLGLATVYGIVQQHHGWIEVSSEVGRGTQFWIFLPVAPPAVAQQPATVTEGNVRGGTERFLLVEDEADLRALAKVILRRAGYDVVEAVSGAAASQVWEQHGGNFELLVTDMIMPDGLTGRELVAQLQAKRPSLKVLLTSGYSPEVVGQGVPLREGVNFLQKPYPAWKLLRVVRGCLDEGREA